MASDNETETCKQVDSPGVNGNSEDVSKEDTWAGSSKFGFGFSSMSGEKVDRRRAAHDLRNADERFAVQTSGVGYDKWLGQ